MSGFPEVDRAMATLIAMCPRHAPDTATRFDPDCGDCGSRQEAAQIYLLGLVDDVKEGLGLRGMEPGSGGLPSSPNSSSWPPPSGP